MKRILILLLALMLCLAFVACNVPDDSDIDTETELDTSENTDISTDEGTDNSNLDNKINIATTINNGYYKQISVVDREYIGNDFPEEYGEYYKVVKTYDELKSLISNGDSIDSSIFDDNYVLILKRHYSNAPWSTFIGFREASLHGEDAYIIADGYYYSDRPRLDVVVEMNSFSYIIITKSCVKSTDDGSVKKLNVIYDDRDYYKYKYASVADEKANKSDAGKAWMLKSKDDIEALNKLYDLKLANISHNYDTEDKYYLAIYSELLRYNYTGFKDFYTDGTNVFITFEMIVNDYGVLEEPVIFFVEIPKEIVENEITGEIIPYYLIEKTEITMIP